MNLKNKFIVDRYYFVLLELKILLGVLLITINVTMENAYQLYTLVTELTTVEIIVTKLKIAKVSKIGKLYIFCC